MWCISARPSGVVWWWVLQPVPVPQRCDHGQRLQLHPGERRRRCAGGVRRDGFCVWTLCECAGRLIPPASLLTPSIRPRQICQREQQRSFDSPNRALLYRSTERADLEKIDLEKRVDSGERASILGGDLTGVGGCSIRTRWVACCRIAPRWALR